MLMAAGPRERSGIWAEQRAQRLLQQAGWHPVARRWRCRWGELDLVLHKSPRRLLLVEVKGRRRCGPDGWGVAALHRGKRLRLGRAWACWLAAHPDWGASAVELVFALVPLPPARGPVRWLRLDH